MLWRLFVPALVALPLTYGVVYLLACLGWKPRPGWLLTDVGIRRGTALWGAAILGPIVGAAIGTGMKTDPGLPWWDSFWPPLLLGYLISAACVSWFVVRLLRPVPRPHAVKEFLAAWERSGLGELPMVEVTQRPSIVRLHFRDATLLEGEALSLIRKLEENLTPEFALIVRHGGQRL